MSLTESLPHLGGIAGKEAGWVEGLPGAEARGNGDGCPPADRHVAYVLFSPRALELYNPGWREIPLRRTCQRDYAVVSSAGRGRHRVFTVPLSYRIGRLLLRPIHTLDSTRSHATARRGNITRQLLTHQEARFPARLFPFKGRRGLHALGASSAVPGHPPRHPSVGDAARHLWYLAAR